MVGGFCDPGKDQLHLALSIAGLVCQLTEIFENTPKTLYIDSVIVDMPGFQFCASNSCFDLFFQDFV